MLSFLSVTVIAFSILHGTAAFHSSLGSQRARKHAIPASSTLRMQPIIDDWKILKSGELVGRVSNHPVLADGDIIKTSPLENPEEAMSKKIVETTSGSKYKLGNPSVLQLKANGKVAPNVAAPQIDEKSLKQALAKAKAEYKLTGLLVGNGNYLLAGGPEGVRLVKPRSSLATRTMETVCRSASLYVRRFPQMSKHCGENQELRKATSGLNRGRFVKFLQFYGRAETARVRQTICDYYGTRHHGSQDIY
ncbi:protein tyrosine kinase [Fragilaria crotonensis]|nr:protein tyrosine kinase [Fragilaria crotonensis]